MKRQMLMHLMGLTQEVSQSLQSSLNRLRRLSSKWSGWIQTNLDRWSTLRFMISRWLCKDLARRTMLKRGTRIGFTRQSISQLSRKKSILSFQEHLQVQDPSPYTWDLNHKIHIRLQMSLLSKISSIRGMCPWCQTWFRITPCLRYIKT